MEHTSARYTVVEPLFFNDELIGVLDGKHVLGKLDRKVVRTVRHEQRSSFKHPLLGGLAGLVFLAVPLVPALADPRGLWLTTAAFIMFAVGIVLLWGVVRRRDEPWIVFVTASGEHAFPLRRDLSPQAAAVLRTIYGDGADAGIRRCCQNCAYDLTANVTGRCPECGQEIPADMREWLRGRSPGAPIEA